MTAFDEWVKTHLYLQFFSSKKLHEARMDNYKWLFAIDC